MVEKFSYPLERSPAMRILGVLWTGKVSGQILAAILLIIGVAFMGALEFAPISIIFFFIFFIPFVIFIHVRIISKGKKLMEGWCDVKYYPESEILEFKTGFPNTMKPDWQEVEINDDNRDIYIKGGEVGGYHIRLGDPENKRDAIRLGLWVKLEDAEEEAEKLAELLGGEIIIDISSDVY